MIAFVIGTGRCGSTLAHEVLCRHRDVAFVSNVDNLLPFESRGRWNNAIYRALPDLVSGRTTTASAPGWGRDDRGAMTTATALVDRFRLRFAPGEAYRLVARSVSPCLDTPRRDLHEDDMTPEVRARFRRFCDDRLRVQGRSHLIHHFTGWPRARYIHAALPQARFLHVIRDGRAVAASLARADWWRRLPSPEKTFGPLPEAYARDWEELGRSPVVLAGLHWKMLMDSFELARTALPNAIWHDVRYEDLVADPRSAFGEVMEFLALDWDPDFEGQFARHTFTAEPVGGYREAVSSRDLQSLDRVLGEQLAGLGYPASG